MRNLTVLSKEVVVKRFRMLLLVLSIAALPLIVASCGDDNEDNATKTVTVTTPAAADTSTSADVDKGRVIKVEVGEAGDKYYIKPAQSTVAPGKVTFAVTNMGDLYHEFIVYTNTAGIDAGDIPVNKADDEAELVEHDIVGEAPYATPPIVPAEKEPGAADHRIRAGGWGAELTVDLKAGKYILLCNLSTHYGTFKQYSTFTVG